MADLATRYENRHGILGLNGLGQPDDYHHHRRGLLQGVAGLGDTAQTVDLPNGTSDTVIGTTTDGMIFTAGGWQSLPMPDGSERWLNVYSGVVMLEDGSLVPPSTVTSSGATTGSILDQVVRAGGTLANGVAQILGQLGIGQSTGGQWISSTQYRTSSGAVVTPVRNANGTYSLPTGQIIGAPSSSSVGVILAVGAVAAAVAWMLGRRRAA